MSLNFREWLYGTEQPPMSDFDVASMYAHSPNLSVSDMIAKSGRSTGEFYRILRKYSIANRQRTNHENVYSFANAGLSVRKIAEFTGYTPRNVRYILKKK